jgi:hypothetical protein
VLSVMPPVWDELLSGAMCRRERAAGLRRLLPTGCPHRATVVFSSRVVSSGRTVESPMQGRLSSPAERGVL